MSEPITGELREKMATLGWYEDGNIVCTTGGEPASEMACLVINSKTFGELCDAIDAVHANLERENESLRRELDRVLGEQEDRDGWVELPKDADGEYIHIGDRMENNERVSRIVLTDDDWEPSVYLEKIPNVLHEYFCNEISHYRPDTWERIIRDAIGEGTARQRSNDSGECRERANPMNNDALIARCRALAGDAS